MVQGRSGCGYGSYWGGALVENGGHLSLNQQFAGYFLSETRSKCKEQVPEPVSSTRLRLAGSEVLLNGFSMTRTFHVRFQTLVFRSEVSFH